MIERKKSDSNPSLDEIWLSTDDRLFVEGDIARNLYLVKKGSLAVYSEKDGTVIATLNQGDCFGEQAVLAGGCRGASVRANSDVCCLELPADRFKATIDSLSPFARTFLNALLLELATHNAIKTHEASDLKATEPVIDIQVDEISRGFDRYELKSLLVSSEHKFSAAQALLLRIASSTELNTTFISRDQDLQTHFDRGQGFVITQGLVEIDSPSGSVRLGPGAVLGLSGGLARIGYTPMCKILKTVNGLLIPTDKARSELLSLKKGLYAIFKSVICRILEVKSVPACLEITTK